MKKTVLALSRFVPALLVAVAFSGITFAQKTPQKKSETTNTNDVNVRIIERDGDNVREIERTYHLDGMNDPQRDKVVMKLVDSLKATRKGNGRQQMTIIIQDNNGDQTITTRRNGPNKLRVPNDVYVQRGKLPKVDRDFWNNQNWRYEFRRGADSMADQLNRFKFEFPKDFDRQFARPFEDWSRNFSGKASTIRGLDAFPNNPDRDQLNVRFTAPAKGDVSIVVTNPKGKEVAKRDIKDFSGEFVGQIDLGKKAQGTYFITVTQNEDGAVKRIVVD
jgi:hypothetical protein